jgi:hypothetical protein
MAPETESPHESERCSDGTDAAARYRISCGRCGFEDVVNGITAAFAAEDNHQAVTDSDHYVEMYLLDE